MNKKELKNIAKKLAKLEKQVMNCSDSKERNKIQMEIMTLCGKVDNLEDITIIDEMVSEILENS